MSDGTAKDFADSDPEISLSIATRSVSVSTFRPHHCQRDSVRTIDRFSKRTSGQRTGDSIISLQSTTNELKRRIPLNLIPALSSAFIPFGHHWSPPSLSESEYISSSAESLQIHQGMMMTMMMMTDPLRICQFVLIIFQCHKSLHIQNERGLNCSELMRSENTNKTQNKWTDAMMRH